jgi:hypothetical protein
VNVSRSMKLSRRHLLAGLVLTLFLCPAVAAQTEGPPNMGIAPKQSGDVGRLDARVVDEGGNPVAGAYVLLRSVLSDRVCESWNWTDAGGVSVNPPIHIGEISVRVKAKGYRELKLPLRPDQLAQPVVLRLTRK